MRSRASLSMQCLYGHSKVEQQGTTKYQCILAMTDAVNKLDDFNKPCSAYTNIAPNGSAYLEQAMSKSVELKSADGLTKARIEVSKLPFKPSELSVSTEAPSIQTPFASWGSRLQQMGFSDSPQQETVFSPTCSWVSFPEGEVPEDKEEESYMGKVALAQALQMVYSRAQRTARVHFHHPEVDTDFGKAAWCSSRMAVQNAEISSAWDISCNMAFLTWCSKCQSRWPPEVADILLN